VIRVCVRHQHRPDVGRLNTVLRELLHERGPACFLAGPGINQEMFAASRKQVRRRLADEEMRRREA
jgi:hypothetical protein